MPNPDRLGSASKVMSYANGGALGADVDLQHDGGAPCRWIRLGVAGDVQIVTASGDTTLIAGVVAGELLRVQAVKILAAGTSGQKITVGW